MRPVFAGPIGFSYPDWGSVFYPPGLQTEKRLAYLGRHFNFVELDTTFYGMPQVSVVHRWRNEASGLRFCLKAPQEITHDSEPGSLQKQDVNHVWHQFLRLAGALGGETLLLLQFPPSFSVERSDELIRFLSGYRTETKNMVLEFRHPTWDAAPTEEWLGLDCCRAWADLPGPNEVGERVSIAQSHWVTGNFTYVRLCGKHGQYESDSLEIVDPQPRIESWCQMIHALPPDRPVFISVGNSYAGHAPATLRRIHRQLGMAETEPLQPKLF